VDDVRERNDPDLDLVVDVHDVLQATENVIEKDRHHQIEEVRDHQNEEKNRDLHQQVVDLNRDPVADHKI